MGRRDAEVVELADIQYEYALLTAQLELVQKDSHLLASVGKLYSQTHVMSPILNLGKGLLLSPQAVVLKLAQSNKFHMAIATARNLNVDMSELFAHLTTQCLRLARNPDLLLYVLLHMIAKMT